MRMTSLAMALRGGSSLKARSIQLFYTGDEIEQGKQSFLDRFRKNPDTNGLDVVIRTGTYDRDTVYSERKTEGSIVGDVYLWLKSEAALREYLAELHNIGSS